MNCFLIHPAVVAWECCNKHSVANISWFFLCQKMSQSAMVHVLFHLHGSWLFQSLCTQCTNVSLLISTIVHIDRFPCETVPCPACAPGPFLNFETVSLGLVCLYFTFCFPSAKTGLYFLNSCWSVLTHFPLWRLTRVKLRTLMLLLGIMCLLCLFYVNISLLISFLIHWLIKSNWISM